MGGLASVNRFSGWRYYRNMSAGFTGYLFALFVVHPLCSAQPAYVEVKVPVGVRSETLFIRYVMDDDFGGWVRPHPDVSSYFITLRQGVPTRFRALLYAPGCAIQTADLPILGPAIPRYAFVCEPLPNIRLTGTVKKPERRDGHEISLQIRYVAPWAQSVLGLGDGMVTDIPMGGTPTVAGGAFQFFLPDLAEDPLAGTSDQSGELRILARDRITGKIVAQLVPMARSLRTRMGGLRIRKDYPEIEFAFCASEGPRLHDSNGFAIRPASDAACDH